MDKKAKYFKGLCLIENWKCEVVEQNTLPIKATTFKVTVENVDKPFIVTVAEMFRDEWVELTIENIKQIRGWKKPLRK